MLLWTMSFLRRRRRRLRDFSCIPWLPPPLGRRTRPLPVTRNRLEAALLVFIFGMGLSDLAAAPVGPTLRGPRGPGSDGFRGACRKRGAEDDGKAAACQGGGGRIARASPAAPVQAAVGPPRTVAVVRRPRAAVAEVRDVAGLVACVGE